jgi:hypothetical protein
MELPEDTLYDILIYFTIEDIIKLNNRVKNLQVLQDSHFWIKKMAHDQLPILINTDHFTFSQWVQLYRTTKEVKNNITLLHHISHKLFTFTVTEFNHIIPYLPENIHLTEKPENEVHLFYKWFNNGYKMIIFGGLNTNKYIDVTEQELFDLLFHIHYLYPTKRF